MSARQRFENSQMALVRWVSRDEFQAYFQSLSPDERWTHLGFPKHETLWHWEERRWWVVEEAG